MDECSGWCSPWDSGALTTVTAQLLQARERWFPLDGWDSFTKCYRKFTSFLLLWSLICNRLNTEYIGFCYQPVDYILNSLKDSLKQSKTQLKKWLPWSRHLWGWAEFTETLLVASLTFSFTPDGIEKKKEIKESLEWEKGKFDLQEIWIWTWSSLLGK